MGDEGQLLETCPVCDYRLESLPVEHRCPECGLAFDRRWRVFGVPVRARVLYLGYVCFQFLLGLLVVLMSASQSTPNHQTREVLLSLALAGMIGLGGVSLLARFNKRKRAMVGVGPKGVTTVNWQYQEATHYDWDLIGRARAEFFPFGKLILTVGGRKVTWDLLSSSQTIDCAKYINSYQRPGRG